MVANLQGGMAGGVTQKVGLGSGQSNAIPFSIQGTTSHPTFVPDVANIAGNVAKGAIQNAVSGKAPGAVPAGATGALGGLLGKKKPK